MRGTRQFAVGFKAARIISMLPTITASRLLKSCAMPPVS